MKIIFKFRLILTAIVIAAISVVFLYFLLRPKDDKENILIDEAKIVDLRPIAELCSMEIYRETVVSDTINHKAIYGIQKQQGSITFDIEGLPSDVKVALSSRDSLAKDTLRLRLPKERVNVFESTAPDSWKVVDTKSLRLFSTSVMTPEEENIAKRRAIERTRRSLYRDGTVARARKEAAITLRDFAEKLTGRPVVILPD